MIASSDQGRVATPVGDKVVWVKVCGIRDEDTADAVAQRRPDAIGLNFYTPSPRCVGVSVAARIVARLPQDVEAVGLFVNHDLRTVLDTIEECSLPCVQIHGDEPPQFLAELQSRKPDLRLLRAFRVNAANGFGNVAAYLAECRNLQVELAGCLVDALVDGTYGGTGHTAPWDLLAREYDTREWPPLILAGGLTPENVAQAVLQTHAYGVDVASGVERERGIKDLNLVAEFISRARAATSAHQ